MVLRVSRILARLSRQWEGPPLAFGQLNSRINLRKAATIAKPAIRTTGPRLIQKMDAHRDSPNYLLA
jgi:hypothetical protein